MPVRDGTGPIVQIVEIVDRSIIMLLMDSSALLAQFQAPAELILVNGTGSVGQLEALRPVRFESLEAAIRYVAEGHSHVQPR